MDHRDRVLERVEALERQTEMLMQYTRTVEWLLRWWRGTAWGLVMLNLLSLALSFGKAADAPAGGMAGCIATLEDTRTARAFDAAANEVVITGANPRIVNGLGHLIVGYHGIREFAQDIRTGSPHVVGGKEPHDSSFGGVMGGQFHEINGAFAAGSGGQNRTAPAQFTWVAGALFSDM